MRILWREVSSRVFSVALLFSLLAPHSSLLVLASSLKRVSVHDPSVVWDSESKSYYIFGSHRDHAKSSDMMNWTKITVPWATPSSNNAANKDAFTTNQTKSVTIGGNSVTFGNFDAHAYSAAYKTYGKDSWGSIDGNMWAPDVIYNKKMGKWCMYLSINGLRWNSSIILLTSDRISGPYLYQGPVIFSGFNVDESVAATSYKKTDLELVIGEQSTLPQRYKVGGSWGTNWPHCIDPCVFYDEEGKLWMSYGSWSGGIYMLRLNEENGLRDYDITYPIEGSGGGVKSDPYFGKKIAGGYYVSGEASYIEYIGGYYFLFVTYGGLTADGGYQMRVFRSEKPDGPYKDSNNVSAIFNSYQLNYGATAQSDRGVNIFGAYTDWGNQAKGNYGERSQGHNSIIAAVDGRTYLVYHTRFQNWGESHQVRVHQVFQNKDGWLVAAPFEYTGEEVKSADIASTQQVSTDRIPGTYKLLIHKYRLDHTKKEAAKPVDITLSADGKISGGATGTWAATAGTSYVNFVISGTAYRGVMVEQTLEPKDEKTIAFTGLASKSGVTAWAYQTKAATGIEGVRSQETGDRGQETGIYDLQGRRISTDSRLLTPDSFKKGIYIKNGKKFIVR